MDNLIEYSDICSKTSGGSLSRYCRDESNTTITDSESFNFKETITRRNSISGNTKDVEVAVSIKYLSIFLKTLEMRLIISEINLRLISSAGAGNSQ